MEMWFVCIILQAKLVSKRAVQLHLALGDDIDILGFLFLVLGLRCASKAHETSQTEFSNN